jgi:hypothetical protein
MIMKKHILIITLILLGTLSNVFSQISVVVDTTLKYQQIKGWGASLFIKDEDRCSLTQENLMNMWFEHMGCNSFRWEISRKEWENFNNDNSNSDSINWSAYKTETCDRIAKNIILPMKAKVEARGEKFWIYQNSSFFKSGETGTIPLWMLESPAEMSEWLISDLKYIKSTHGITIDHIAVANEPDNDNVFTSNIVGKMIKTLGPAMQQAGLSTKIIFSEHARTDSALSYIQRWQNDPEVMDYVTCFGNHLYFGTEKMSSKKAAIYSIAQSKNIVTAQTEYMGANFDIIYDDLVNGGNSFWHIYLDRDYIAINQSKTAYTINSIYWDIRQIVKYVKQGSYRVSVSSNNTTNCKTMAFNKDGNVVVVCKNTGIVGTLTFDISGLPAGVYAVNKGKTEAGLMTVTPGGKLSLSIEQGKVATIYATGGANQVPLVTGWSAGSSYITSPTSSTTLNVTVADQENDPITYSWSVKKQPVGGSAQIVNESSATASATNLTTPGDYAFTVTINDGINTVLQDVYLRVVGSNQPPVLYGMHNRIPVYMQLPTGNKTSLRCVVYDPEGDAATVAWTIVSQPVGAATQLSSPTTTGCDASNMTVAGDYIFRLTATDKLQSSSREIKVTVHPANNTPVISSVDASPSKLVSSESFSTLTAIITDADNEAPSFWWTVKQKPAGSNPVFSNPGRNKTDVTGLTEVGTYIFTVLSADNVSKVSRDITVIKDINSISNISLNKPTIADSESNSTYISSHAVDGISTDATKRWISANTSFPHWIEIDLQGFYKVNQVKFWTGWGGLYNEPVGAYQIQTWDGTNWVTAVDISGNVNSVVDHTFTNVTTNKVRLYATEGTSGNLAIKLYEIEVYGTATTSVLSLNSLSISVFPNPAKDKINIYFGTIPNEKTNVILTDLTGKAFYKNEFPRVSTMMIPTIGISKGMYILTVSNGSKFVNKKICIE